MANIGNSSPIQRDDHKVNFSNPQVPRNNTKVKNKKNAKLHIEAISITIGNWQYIAQRPLGAVAKWYFGRKKIIWEILENNMKKKIEISWSNLSGMRAIFNENKLGTLEVLLKDRPLFFEEIPKTKNIHTRWKESHDFTNGNAQRFRMHTIHFSPGYLKGPYEELLDRSLLFKNLSECPFQALGESLVFEDQPSTVNFIQDLGEYLVLEDLRKIDQPSTVNFWMTSVMSQSNPFIVNELGNTSYSGNMTEELPSISFYQNLRQDVITFYESEDHIYKNSYYELNGPNNDPFENMELPTESDYEWLNSLLHEEDMNTVMPQADSGWLGNNISLDGGELQNWNNNQQPWLYSDVNEDVDCISSILSSFRSDPTMENLNFIDHEKSNFQSRQV